MTRNMFGSSQARTTRNWRTQRLRALVKAENAGTQEVKKIPQHILFTWVMSNNPIFQSERYAKATKNQLRPRLGQIFGVPLTERESEEGQIVGGGQQRTGQKHSGHILVTRIGGRMPKHRDEQRREERSQQLECQWCVTPLEERSP